MNMDNIGPAGSMNSNIDDMLIWLQMWINEGIYNGNEILAKTTFQTMTSTKVMTSSHSSESYGFGWFIELDKGRKVLSHGGGMPGYKSLVTLIPENKTGLIILTNKISYLNEELAGIINEYLETKKINWEEVDQNLYGRNFHFPWDEEIDTSNQLKSFIPNLSLYKGMYEDKQYGKALIQERNGKAILELLPTKKQLWANLYFLTKARFKIIFNDGFIPAGEIIFEWDSNKKIKGFKMDISSSDFHFKYLNFKKK